MGGKDKWTYTLNEPRQGSVAVRLRLGDMDGWCADAPALAQGKPPSTAKSDRPDLFKSQRNAPAPAVCPAVPAGGPPRRRLPRPGGAPGPVRPGRGPRP